MTTGMTVTGSLTDSLPKMIASARIVREFDGVMSQLVDNVTLGTGAGLDWNEISLSQLEAQGIAETTELNNPQQIADTLLTITPTQVGIQTRITDRVAARISANVYSQIGQLAQNAIQRKKDKDGLTELDSGATTASPGAGGTLNSGYIAAAKYNISSNTTEPGPPPYRCVLHGFQIGENLVCTSRN